MKLDRKQKILLTLIIVAVAYLLWQIYDMFFAGSVTTAATTTSTISAAPAAQSFQPVTTTTSTQTSTTPIMTAAAPKMTTVTTQQQTTQPLREVTLRAPLTDSQRQYLKLVNQYQLVKMQRMVADEQAAMVSSKEKIAEANQQIAKMSGGVVQNSASILDNSPSSTSPTGYQLMYIDYQNGHWTATLNKNGQFQEVEVGTTLSDGTRILKIDQNGAVINQSGKTYLLNFYGSTSLANTTVLNKPPIVRTPADSYRLHGAPSLNPLVVAPPKPKKQTHKTTITHTQKKQVVMQVKPAAPAITLDAPLTTNQAKALLEPTKTGLDLSSQEKNAMLKLENGAANNTAMNNVNYTADEKYLLSLPPHDYTLQVLGSYNVSDLTKLMQTNNLQGKAYIFHTYYMGKDWYVLVYGTYTTETQALQAMKNMPKALQESKPWVRQLADVHAAINLNLQKST